MGKSFISKSRVRYRYDWWMEKKKLLWVILKIQSCQKGLFLNLKIVKNGQETTSAQCKDCENECVHICPIYEVDDILIINELDNEMDENKQ